MSGTSQTILVVEDNADSRRLFHRALTMKNYEVRQAANGQEALDALDISPCPDVILLDLSMPKMNGAKFLEHLRSHAKCSKVKVAIVSGWDNLKAHAEELGTEGFIRKPVDLDALEREVARLIALPL